MSRPDVLVGTALWDGCIDRVEAATACRPWDTFVVSAPEQVLAATSDGELLEVCARRPGAEGTVERHADTAAVTVWSLDRELPQVRP